MNLDCVIQFRRAAVAHDGLSGNLVWGNHGQPIRAQKTDVRDYERFQNGRKEAYLSARFIVRWSPFTADIGPQDTLLCQGRSYEIIGIKDHGARRGYLEITTLEARIHEYSA